MQLTSPVMSIPTRRAVRFGGDPAPSTTPPVKPPSTPTATPVKKPGGGMVKKAVIGFLASMGVAVPGYIGVSMQRPQPGHVLVVETPWNGHKAVHGDFKGELNPDGAQPKSGALRNVFVNPLGLTATRDYDVKTINHPVIFVAGQTRDQQNVILPLTMRWKFDPDAMLKMEQEVNRTSGQFAGAVNAEKRAEVVNRDVLVPQVIDIAKKFIAAHSRSELEAMHRKDANGESFKGTDALQAGFTDANGQTVQGLKGFMDSKGLGYMETAYVYDVTPKQILEGLLKQDQELPATSGNQNSHLQDELNGMILRRVPTPRDFQPQK